MKFKYRLKIGPHNEDILSVIYGTLLGDSSIEKRSNNIRFCFQQENKNVEYLFWLWNLLSESGYCSQVKPILRLRTAAKGKIRFYYKFNTYTFPNLNYIYEQFFWNSQFEKKRVPINIIEHLTPLAFACWIMDDGSKVGSGIKLATLGFIKEDVELLANTLLKKWNISTTIQKTGKIDQWVIYIPKKEIVKVQLIVGKHIVKSMLYKIHK